MDSINKVVNHQVTQNLIKLFAVIFVYKMFDTQFLSVQKVFKQYYIVRVLFVFVLLYVLTRDITQSIGFTTFWFLLEFLFSGNRMNLMQNKFNANNPQNKLNANNPQNIEVGETLPVNYYNDNSFLPNKVNQIRDMALNTYYSQPGSSFPTDQVDVLDLVDEGNNTPVPKKNYLDTSDNILEGFCGSENCAL